MGKLQQVLTVRVMTEKPMLTVPKYIARANACRAWRMHCVYVARISHILAIAWPIPLIR